MPIDLTTLLPVGIWADIFKTDESLFLLEGLYKLSAEIRFTLLDSFRQLLKTYDDIRWILDTPGLGKYYAQDSKNKDFYVLIGQMYLDHIDNPFDYPFNKKTLADDWLEQAVALADGINVAEVYYRYLTDSIGEIIDYDVDERDGPYIPRREICADTMNIIDELTTMSRFWSIGILFFAINSSTTSLAKLPDIFRRQPDYDDFEAHALYDIDDYYAEVTGYFANLILEFAETDEGQAIKEKVVAETQEKFC